MGETGTSDTAYESDVPNILEVCMGEAEGVQRRERG